MRRYEVIFFDLDHTLIDTRRQYDLGLAVALKQMYSPDVPQDFSERFLRHHDLLWADYDQRKISMLDLRRQRFLRAWQDYGVDKTLEEADAFHELYSNTFEYTLFAYDGVIEMLDALSTSHRLGIITNGAPDLQWRKMGITGLQKYFQQEAVIISEDVGLGKPDPRVYQFACDKLKVDHRDSLMIGDNYRGDVSGARSFGMDAVWFVPDPGMYAEVAKAVSSESPIQSASELVEYVGKLEQSRQA